MMLWDLVCWLDLVKPAVVWFERGGFGVVDFGFGRILGLELCDIV